ncbi:MAG: hypothetical protein R3E44_12735 [Paracoccaceae bacterium]
MRSPWAIIIAAAASCLPAASRADPVECQANLNGVEVAITYDGDAEVYSSFRERRFTRRKTCPGAAVVAYMMPGLSEDERAMFCVVYDRKAEEYRTVAEGPRDAYGRCKQPTSRACRIVNATREEALEIGATGLGLAGTGVKAVRNKAGALVLSGKAGAVAGFLSEAGGAAAAAVSAPGVLAGAAVSVVVVGGAVVVCG